MRCAAARAATRRGWSMARFGCPGDKVFAAISAGGTRVVLPAPGGATSTNAREALSLSMISVSEPSIGRGTIRSPVAQLIRRSVLEIGAGYHTIERSAGER